MDFNELKQNAEQIYKELKEKALADFFCACTLVVNHHQNDDSHVLQSYGAE